MPDLDPCRPGRGVAADPVGAGQSEGAVRVCGRRAADGDPVVGRVLVHDVPGAVPQSQSLPLADREEVMAAMLAEQAAALPLHDRPGPLAQPPAHEVAVADPAQEADALAVRPRAGRQAVRVRLGADDGLRRVPDRERRARELTCAHVGQEIGLILDGIGGGAQPRTGAGVDHARVVAGGDRVEPVREALREHPELDVAVAHQVRAGRVAGAQLAHDVVQHALEVVLLDGHHVQRHAPLLADRARVFQVLLPRAVAQAGQLLLEPDLEVEGGDAGARLLQPYQRHRTVDAAGQEQGGVQRGLPRGCRQRVRDRVFRRHR